MKDKALKTKQGLMAAVVGLMVAATGQAEAKPLKVFILAGQSNMEGPAHIRTITGIGEDPATAAIYRAMMGPEGKPVVCQNVWLSYLTGEGDNHTIETTGRMTAGYGSLWGMDHRKPGDKIGPEFTFGIYMGQALKEPILIIKTAWYEREVTIPESWRDQRLTLFLERTKKYHWSIFELNVYKR